MGKWTRRAFLTTGVIAGGGLIVGVAMRPGNQAGELSDLLGDDGGQLVHAYVRIDSDNTITAMVPHSEMGQGAQTALAQMLAEELDADWNDMRIEEAPAIGAYSHYSLGRKYLLKGINFPDFIVPSVDGAMMKLMDNLGLQVTGGSMSIRMTGSLGMRVAGASTRQMLRKAAASAWQVPLKDITTDNSHLVHTPSSRREPYASFVNEVAKMTPSQTPEFKKAEDYKIVGKFVPRLDIPSKVDGSAQFALDIRRPGMLYATVIRAPVFGATIVSIDDQAARKIEGVADVIELPPAQSNMMIGGFQSSPAVAVIADSYWTAKKGRETLNITWSDVDLAARSSTDIFAQFAKDITASEERQSDRLQGDTPTQFLNASKVIEADYTVPFLAHTCMEPLNATAEISNGQCEIWVGCQNPLGFRKAVAEALSVDEEKVTLHNQLMGGGFGRKSRPDYAIQAAQIAKAVGRPIQLIWSREEDIRQDFYRPAIQSRFKGGIDENGKLLVWENTYVNKAEPTEAPLIPYAVEAQDIGHVSSPTHVPFGAWRSVDHSQHGFFTESFIDEAANATGKDALKFRLDLLKDKPRHLAVLKRAAEEANWETPLAKGRGKGISLQESFGSIVAQVVEVSIVDKSVSVDRVVAVIDPGLAIAPDGMKAQIESGIIYGLSAAMYGEITIQDGAVVESNFHDYRSLRMSDAPTIETHIINSGHELGGGGEPGTPGIAPALANAVYAASGIRVRSLPLMKAFSS
ncbi:MAG: xanthine dehydrogenase family protein molybdopterin-binding subunit [SAR92 clade bacterium]|uniref:Xanthine dehydrogenase family protein molybdopterin-binding subunit n=1 Tax=SAR92 clade bacterium TaxID=2315479 RepID=A0A520MDP6_9GAMM|nr:MAG: xanthine dehydrogenase family protein molybdopterin-binding subunit [SAR92 clade bacterium]